MIEEIMKLYLEGNIKQGKKFVKENYEELSQLVYAITVSNEYIEGTDGVNGYATFIKYLSECGHNLDFVDDNGNTALHGAVNGQDPIMVTAFLEHKELFTKANKDGITPIMLGFTKPNEDVKKILALNIGECVNDIINVNGQEMTYLTLAIFTSSPEIMVPILMNDKFDYEVHKPFLEDVEWDENDLEDYERQNLINNYLERHNTENENLEDNLEEDEEFYSPMNKESLYHYVVKQDVDSISRKLNELDIEEELPGYTALNLAIAMQNEEMVNVLLKKSNVNHRTTSGITPLLCAVIKENVNLVKKLIKMGAYLESPLYNGLEPIFYAVAKNNEEITKILLNNNVYINDYNMNVILDTFDDDEHKKCINLLKNYKKTIQKKHKYPFEGKYELGIDSTYESDGYYKVEYVLNTEYGSQMINYYGANSAFAIPGPSIIDVEIKEKCKKVVAPSINTGGGLDLKVVVGFLTESGKVIAYDINTKERIKEIEEWENIIDIESTDYNLIGLSKDGTIKVFQPQFYQFYEEVLNWKDIVKISTGTNIVYAIDKNNNFYYAGSAMNETLMGEQYKKLQDIKKVKDISSTFTSAVIVDIDDKIIPINVDSKIKFVENFKQISCGMMHAVVLKNDGTLLSFGNNDMCQCNTVKWHDIIRVQATPYCTIGYASDGEILCTENMSGGNMMLNPQWNPGFGNMTKGSTENAKNIMNL